MSTSTVAKPKDKAKAKKSNIEPSGLGLSKPGGPVSSIPLPPQETGVIGEIGFPVDLTAGIPLFDPDPDPLPEGAKIPPKSVQVIDPITGETTLKDFTDVTEGDIASTPGLGEAIITAEGKKTTEPFVPPFAQAKHKKLGRKATLLTGGSGVKGKARTKKALLGGA